MVRIQYWGSLVFSGGNEIIFSSLTLLLKSILIVTTNHFFYNVNDSSLNFYIIVNNHTIDVGSAVVFIAKFLILLCRYSSILHRDASTISYDIRLINMNYLKLICNEIEQLTQGLRLRKESKCIVWCHFFILDCFFLCDL